MIRKHISILATTVVFTLLYLGASAAYPGIFSLHVFINLLNDNAFLGLTALGMTLVILSGGIDLSVGAMIGFTSIFIATLVQMHGVHPLLAMSSALTIGTAFGGCMGFLIAR
ncbi:MAG: sugar ABC transporter permease YjfF, partial [bacterium]